MAKGLTIAVIQAAFGVVLGQPVRDRLTLGVGDSYLLAGGKAAE